MKSRCFKYEVSVFFLTAVAMLMIGLSIKNIVTYRKNTLLASKIIADRATPKTLRVVKAVSCEPEEIAFLVKGAFSSIPMKINVSRKEIGIYIVNMLSNSLSYSTIMSGFTNLHKFFSVQINSVCIGYECGKNKVNMSFEMGTNQGKKVNHIGGKHEKKT